MVNGKWEIMKDMSNIYYIWVLCGLTTFFSMLHVINGDITHIQPIIASFFIFIFVWQLKDEIK